MKIELLLLFLVPLSSLYLVRFCCCMLAFGSDMPRTCRIVKDNIIIIDEMLHRVNPASFLLLSHLSS